MNGPKESIQTRFRSLSWEETSIGHEDDRPKLTRARCRQAYTGDIVGESELEYLMTYGGDGRANFVGLERFTVEVRGKKGSFVLRHLGSFEDGVAKIELEVVTASGTGELSTLSGGGSFESAHAEEYPLSLELSL